MTSGLKNYNDLKSGCHFLRKLIFNQKCAGKFQCFVFLCVKRKLMLRGRLIPREREMEWVRKEVKKSEEIINNASLELRKCFCYQAEPDVPYQFSQP